MPHKYIGQPIKRKEDNRLIQGRGKYISDVKVPNCLHAAIVRSPHAHAYLKGIDTQAALAMPGVVAVYTAESIEPYLHHPKRIPLRPGRNLLKPTTDIMRPLPPKDQPFTGLERFLQRPLAVGKVRYVGEPVAVVVAVNPYTAEDAVEAVEVEYEPLPAVVDVADALKDEVVLHEEVGTNICAEAKFSVGDVNKAFAAADYTRKEVFHTHRLTGSMLETRGLLAMYDNATDRLVMWGPTKVPYHNRYVLATLLDMPESKIHFIEPDVGAGFGVRGEFYAEDFLIPLVALRLKRPVKWIEDRREDFMGTNHSRQQTWEIEIAVKRDGTILGARARVDANLGAYIRSHGVGPVAGAATLLLGPYKIRNYECIMRGLMTNKMGTGTLRAPGRYESTFVRERMLDMVAKDLGIDPLDIRRKNLVPAADMPYSTGVSFSGRETSVFDSGDYPALFDRAIRESKYEDLLKLNGKLVDGKYHGVGVGNFVESTGGGGLGPFEGARVVVNRDGRVTVYVGITVLGQGQETTMAQVCAETLDVPVETVDVLHGDTDDLPYGAGTTGSRGAVMGGNAVYLAALEAKRKALAFAGRHFELNPDDLELREGVIYQKSDRSKPLVTLQGVADLLSPMNFDVFGEVGLQATAYYKGGKQAFSYGTHVAHVAVDAETGKVDLLSYFTIEDIGRAINPMIVHGQAIGAAAHGISETMLEEVAYDPNGQLLSSTYMDYLVVTSTDLPPITSIAVEEHPSPFNPLGLKGAGEGGLVATAGTISNAVCNALRDYGVEIRRLPLTPTYVWSLLQEARAKAEQKTAPAGKKGAS